MEIWRSAMQLIQEVGVDGDPRGHALSKASEAHGKGETDEAIHWAKVANAVDKVLEDSPGAPQSGEVH